jgi:hypothetical protein
MTFMHSSNVDKKEHALERTIEARKRFWQKVGQLDPDVLSFLINPAFTGGPYWPAMRQAFCKINTENTVILASDGLSDPFDDEEEANQGFQLECYIETEDISLETDISEVSRTWVFQLLYQIAQNMAAHGGVKKLLDQYGVLSMEVYNVDVPDQWVNEEGRVGLLLGIESPGIPSVIRLPFGETRLVSIKLLTLRELDFVLEHGTEGRWKLVELFQKQGSFHRSSLNRESVV